MAPSADNLAREGGAAYSDAVEALLQAASFGRVLLALSRGRQTGVMCVGGEFGACWIAIDQGVPRAARFADGAPGALGDTLVAQGALDRDGLARTATDERESSAPVGVWLVERGLVTRSAVEIALRGQLRARIVRLFSCRALEYRFEDGVPDAGVPLIEEPMCAEDIVMIALRAHAGAVPEQRIARVIPAHELELTEAGRRLVQCAALWPEETVAASLLRRGATWAAIARATSGSLRALRWVALLSLLGALRPRRAHAGDFALLLRKRAELRDQKAPHALLDVPQDAGPVEARRALRRLAARVHPDRLGEGASAALRRASNEVMSALIDAERTLRTRDARALD